MCNMKKKQGMWYEELIVYVEIRAVGWLKDRDKLVKIRVFEITLVCKLTDAF